MGKISKKYIGDDQVGHIQLELENAGSLRAKSFDGLSSVDLLEYSASNLLVVQQDLHIADEKILVSDASIGDTFYIRTENSANATLFSNHLATGNTGVISLLSGNAADGDSGNIQISTGTASDSRGYIQISAESIFNEATQIQEKVGSSGYHIANLADYSSRIDIGYNSFGQASESWGFSVQNAGSVNSLVIGALGKNDISPGPVHVTGATVSSSTGGTFTGGGVAIYSGSGEAWSVSAANAEISSGFVNITTRNAFIKGTGANASSGSIMLATGTKEGTGTRGSITLDAKEVQCSAMQFKNAADPTLAQDLATKAYVDSQIAAGTTCHKEEITLSAGDIVNQYVDLQEQMIPESLVIGVGARVNLYETLDYTVSVVGGVTRLTFAGPSATGGAEELVDGDKLYITGIVDISP